jgi:glycosyltransferase involved in cell wall biosynthesis
MDVRLYWSGDLPGYLGPLLEALEALPETEDAPDGEVVFCPDATAFPPPTDTADGYVAAVPNTDGLYNPATREPLAQSLAGWAQRGSLFVVPTPSAAANLRVLLSLPAERVHVVTLPLPPERIPPAAANGPGADVLAIPPIAYNSLLPAVNLVRLAGLDPRLVIADPAAEPVVRPGGLANAHGLLAGQEAVAVPDWREEIASAGAIVLFESHPGDGWKLRQALASGVPVVTPQTSLVSDHLTAVGAGAYPYANPNNTASLAAAIAAALRRDRGTDLEAAAREAVLAESWPGAASALYGVLMESLAPGAVPAAPAEETAPVRAGVTNERLSVCVLNPRSSEGGGERFMRELVVAMALHGSKPQVRLVCQIKPFEPFDPGTAMLERAGVDVRTVPGADFDQVAAREIDGADIVYYSWPHMSDPLVTKAPLACTFHDLNWKHFDVYDPADKVQLEAQTPRWIELSSALVHSSNFIRGEMQHYYGTPDSLSHVIPLTAETPAEPATQAEREGVRRRFGLPERFLLSPAGCHLHKNYPVLDAALRVLRRQGRPIKVVASGAGTDIRYHGPDLIGLGYVNARELQSLYEESDGMVQTSLYEAGSFPMWEAMTVSKPVAISRVPPIVEQVERLGATVELFDPLDPDDVAAALARLWDGSPATTPQALERNAAATAARTWDDVAGDYLELFADLRAAHGA